MIGPVSHSFIKALRGVPDLAALDDRTLLKLFGAAATLFWPRGTLVFEKGSPADGLYVLIAGAVSIADVTSNGRELEVRRLEPGDYFGDLSLLRSTDHSMRARTLEDSELMVLPKGAFEHLLASDETLAAYFRGRFEERAAAFGVDDRRRSRPA